MTPEQQLLVAKAQNSLDAANQLVQQGFYDIAVSRADYDLQPDLSSQDAQTLITQAQALIDLANQYLGERLNR